MPNAKFRAIEQEMNQIYLERQEAIRGLMVGLIAGEHIVLLGPPGTGKSDMSENLTGRITGRYFHWLMMRTTTPDEIFGPVSVSALKNDSYKRNTTAKLVEADVVFLDEVWKANSAVLNSLLGIMNERQFDNDGQSITCPLQFLVGASNEMPEDKQELGALWDRFMLRYIVGDIKNPKNFEILMNGQNIASTCTTITMQELAAAQAEAEQVDVRAIVSRLTELRQKVTALNIYCSPRRWKKAVKLVKAHAWLECRKQATDDDLAILAAVVWDEPAQLQEVRKTILALANPMDIEATNILDEATELWQKAVNEQDADKMLKLGSEANKKLKALTGKLQNMREKAIATKKGTAKIDETLVQLMNYNQEVVSKCFGIKV